MRRDSSKIADWLATAPIRLAGKLKEDGVHRRATVETRSLMELVENRRLTATGTVEENSLLPVTSANADKLPDIISTRIIIVEKKTLQNRNTEIAVTVSIRG